MKKTILFALTIAIFGCGASEQELKQKAEQEKKSKDSIVLFEKEQASKKLLDSMQAYADSLEYDLYEFKKAQADSVLKSLKMK
jgi:hypothetical protein